ncbi:PBPRA1643 family SWIM/SEC-C metal-binding motif protein [Thalassotalea crassostreae]|uniref:PBPRA1643 family SWIM/SEC-C metal-binding motif protein n=1 Tax=Thalassotalea crassostreae TaxID=1763536 RepID=UPI0008391607|nr:PBPRA1643 family SWIM/SEC-C metal-binding motif protein [Thalassotalea crassostreae]
MSKFFFKGRPDIMGNYGKAGYAPKPATKLGSAAQPLNLTVVNEQRYAEVLAIIEEHDFIANITIDEDAEENLLELDAVMNKPKTQVFEKTPKRNDPCSCGSGKKFKKCCGQ